MSEENRVGETNLETVWEGPEGAREQCAVSSRRGWSSRLRFGLRAGLLTAALACFAAAPGMVSAQEAEEPPAEGPSSEESSSEEYVVEDEVFVEGRLPDIPTSNTVAAKLPLSLQETPASVSVVPSPLIEQQRGFVLGDALKNAAGLNVQTGNGVFDYFVVRGIDSVTGGLILTDGAPEPETTFYQLYNVDRVEVLKGPSAFLYGGSPLSGTVNLVRKQPQGQSFTRLRTSAGSFNTFEASIDTNHAFADGAFAFRLNSLYQESDNFRDDKESSNFAINPAFAWRPNADTTVTFNAEVVDTEYVSDAGLPILFDGSVAPVPRERSYQSPFDLSEQDLLRLQLDVEHRFSDHLTLRNKTYYRSLEWLSRGTNFNGVFPDGFGGLQVSRTLLDLDDEQVFLGNQLELLSRFDLGPTTHSLLVGLEVSQLEDEFTFGVGLLPSLDLFNPQEPDPVTVVPIPGQAFGADARSLVTATYAVDQIVFNDFFQLLLGVRYDNIDFEDDLFGTDRTEDEVSPMVGVVLSPSDDLSFYASAGEAFAPPSTFVVGEEREPETSNQIEFGVKQRMLGGKLQGTLAIYRIDREKIAIPDPNGVTQQTGDQRSEGVELELVARPADGWTARFAYAYTDAELTEFTQRVQVAQFPPAFLTLDRSGNTPAFAPEHLANAWVSKTFDNGFGLGGGARYVSEQFIAEDNAFTIDSYTTFDAAVFYELPAWRFQVNFKNLTDEEYFTRGFGNTSVIPAPGFEAYGGVEYRF
ncbi:MAG: TonB-dependent siderophore receptor [Acidobacteriota bacterium]|nr:TonB-dependent siderophore receptor [Acidobacteriota bacterium]